MKSNIFSKLVISIAPIFMLASCASEVEPGVTSGSGEAQTMRMSLNINKTGFDASGEDVRSASYDWKDGDVIYLRFQADNGVVKGNASYNASQGDWTVNYYGTINRDKASTVEVLFIEGQGLTEGVVSLTSQLSIYQDKAATYTYQSADKILYMTANLAPITSRIRFKGNAGDKGKIGGLTTYNSYDLSSGSLTTVNNSINCEINADGYSDYIYGVLSSADNPQITVEREYYLYKYNCPSNVMVIGKSGWINLPTQTSHNGWSEEFSGLMVDGYLCMDLGLPSGLKWATCNVGASSPSDYGDYFAWGEISTKDTYTEDNSVTFEKDGYDAIGGDPRYDAARARWGGSWRLPSETEFQELIDYCDWSWATLGGKDGYKVTSKSNGTSIFLPAAGWRLGGTLDGGGSSGNYWSSTPNGSNSSDAQYLSFDSGGHDVGWDYRYYGHSVRPVAD